MKKEIREKQGVTLIALVVTLIILIILVGVSIYMLMGENGLLEHAKWGSFATAFREVEEEQMLYESDKMIEEVVENTKLGVEEEKGVKQEVNEEEKKEIEENNKSLAIKMQELSGKPVEEMQIYWIDENKIKNVKDEKYILDVETSQLYKYEGEKIYGKIWHTLDDGIREDDEYIENSDKENWEGWIKLTLNYPEGSTDRQWRLGAEGETRNDPELRWQAYEEPIWVRIQDVENVWMKYKMNGEDIIIAPSGRVVVDIEPDSYYPDLREKVKVKINYDKGAEIKEYKIGNSDWQEYEGEFYVTENTIVEARAKKVEKIVDEFGEIVSETESWGTDSIYINNVGIEEEENLPAPSITKKAGGEGEVAKVAISYPTESEGGKLIYKINYGEEQEYTGEIGIKNNGTYVIAYYYNKEGKRSKASSILIKEGGANTGSNYTPNKPGGKPSQGGSGSQEGSNPTSPSEIIPGPSISVSNGNVTIGTPSGYTAKTIYYKIGGGNYREYTGTFNVGRSCTVYAYYVTTEGKRSKTTYKQIYVAEPNMPQVSIELNPSPYVVKYKAEKVTATIVASDSNLVEYSFNGVEWTTYSKPIEITKNCRIYARGTNANGETIVYADVTNLGDAPEVKEELAVNISTQEETDSSGAVTKVQVSIGYDGRAEKKYYKIGAKGELQEYTGAFEVEENCTIYAYAIAENGYGEAQKSIGGFSKGISNPIITGKPSKGQQASEVSITIEYDQNATEKKYKINNGTWQNYTGPFTVEENGTIYAYNTNSRNERGDSSYIIDNIIKEKVTAVIEMGDYYIIRLTYPPTAINQEYKWQEEGEWKPYHETGILLVKEQMKDKVNGADIVKVKDEGGKEITFDKEDIYFITKPVNELVEQIYMRWDNMMPTMPEIVLSTESPCLELDATIEYEETLVERQYRVVYPNGVITSWKDYQAGEKIHVTQNGTIIYAKGQDETGMWTQTAKRQITNIDENPPEIKVTGDLEAVTTNLTLQVNVTDDMGIEEIKWATGNQLESYFAGNGETLYDRETEENQAEQKTITKPIEIGEKGYYTIYAKDIAGNSGTYTLYIANVSAILMNLSSKMASDYSKTTITIQITSREDLQEVTVNGESLEIPAKGTNGKYTLTKDVMQQGEYTVKATDVEGNSTTQKIAIADDITQDMDIYNLDDLKEFRDKVNEGRTYAGRTVRVMNDIDMNTGKYTVTEDGTVTFSSDAEIWTPIANYVENKNLIFSGTFDGQNHSISGLYINMPSKGEQALFGCLQNGTIKNLTIENAKIVGQYLVAALVSCSSEQNLVNTQNLIEGIKIEETVTVTSTGNWGSYGSGHAGGISSDFSGTIRQCYNKAAITSKYGHAGGIVAVYAGGTIERCFNKGKIIVENGEAAGGITSVNINGVNINDCYNLGDIKANQYVGGITGYKHQTGTSKLTNCYNKGNITGTSNIGQIIGTGGTISNCYASDINVTAQQLGNSFVEDTIGINNGYPILKWQLEEQ